MNSESTLRDARSMESFTTDFIQESFSNSAFSDGGVEIYGPNNVRQSSAEVVRLFGRASNERLSQVMRRCKIAVEHGLGYTSDVDLEAYRSGTHADSSHHLDPSVEIPANTRAGKAVCLTLSYRQSIKYYVYIAALFDDEKEEAVQAHYVDFVSKLDARMQTLGRGWLVGGALPKGYERLGEYGEP